MAFMVVSEDGHIVFRQNARPLRPANAGRGVRAGGGHTEAAA